MSDQERSCSSSDEPMQIVENYDEEDLEKEILNAGDDQKGCSDSKMSISTSSDEEDSSVEEVASADSKKPATVDDQIKYSVEEHTITTKNKSLSKQNDPSIAHQLVGSLDDEQRLADSDLCHPDLITNIKKRDGGPFMDPKMVDIIESELARVNEATCGEPTEDSRSRVESKPPPSDNLPSTRAPTDIIVRAGPSWAEASEAVDSIAQNRLLHARATGRHHLGGDVSIACQLACQIPNRYKPPLEISDLIARQRSYRDFEQENRFATERSSRHTPYNPYNQKNSGTGELRRSRFTRNLKSNSGLQNQIRNPYSNLAVPPLAYPTLQTFNPNPVLPQLVPFSSSSIRQVTNPNFTPSTPFQIAPRIPPQLFDPHTQFIPRSTPQLFRPGSPPELIPINTPHFIPRSPQPLHPHIPIPQSSDSYDLPVLTIEPIDLSVTTTPIPALIPITQALPISVRSVETRTSIRSIPRTHTVTSSSFAYLPTTTQMTNTEELNQTASRFEMYASCSEHLLNQPSVRRSRTAAELPEHLLYQQWPVDDISFTDHTEIEISECDVWFGVQTADKAADVCTPVTSTPVTRQPPSASSSLLPPISASPIPTRTTSTITTSRTTPPPRTTSSPENSRCQEEN